MTYNFELGEAVYCQDVEVYDRKPYLKVTQTENTITVLDRPVGEIGECDPPVTLIKVRSLRCLYLWHCGTRYPL